MCVKEPALTPPHAEEGFLLISPLFYADVHTLPGNQLCCG